ncbi:hypothetical protein TNCV_2975841 [Trichonephila clavipes]|nr:hypothetical protein TNCV_2975841 [Trichonephila clavipes]
MATAYRDFSYEGLHSNKTRRRKLRAVTSRWKLVLGGSAKSAEENGTLYQRTIQSIPSARPLLVNLRFNPLPPPLRHLKLTSIIPESSRMPCRAAMHAKLKRPLSSGVVHVDHGSTWSVTRAAEQCDVNLHSLTSSSDLPLSDHS